MHLIVLLCFFLNLLDPAEVLNPKRKRFFQKNVEATTPAFANETAGTRCSPAPKLRFQPVFEGPTNDRQKAVVRAFQHAWMGYKKYAWGHDELKPVSKSYENPFELGLTIVDSLDTAVIMGLKTETREAIDWIRDSLDVSPDRSVNLFETTIRVLGGLLSGYHLTGEAILLKKAKILGDNLLFAFTKSKSPIPKSDVNLQSGSAFSPNQGLSSLSEATTLQLEFRDLAILTGNSTYENVAFGASEHIHKIGCKQTGGLCPYFIDDNGNLKSTDITLGARADSYYEYLLKQWLQTKKSIDWLRDDFLESVNSIREILYRSSASSSLKFIGEVQTSGEFYPKMDHLVCFFAGTLVLSHQNGLDTKQGDHLEMAKQLGHVCHKMYENPTGLGPEIAHFNMETSSEEDIYSLDSHSLLRPEAIEAWFYLYRATNDKKYQEWGWSAFEAIEKYAKVETGGYSSIDNVFKIKVKRRSIDTSAG
uniref:alpha-1,2-Mannosidase n=1 Tax=Caenorhabditis japonica TaxID=281687 RepID=A0A8R1DSL1_CAEJA